MSVRRKRSATALGPGRAGEPFNFNWYGTMGFYFDANYINGFTTPVPAAGSEVYTWTDLSGNGRHAKGAAAAPGVRPLWQPTALNGKPAVVFDGINDTLALTDKYTTDNNGTIYAVAYQSAVDQEILASDDNYQFVRVLGTPAKQSAYHPTPGNFILSSAVSFSVNTPYVYAFKLSTGGVGTWYWNGVSSGTATNSVFTGLRVNTLGYAGYQGSNYSLLNGGIGAILVYPAAHSTTLMEEISGQLMRLWGVS